MVSSVLDGSGVGVLWGSVGAYEEGSCGQDPSLSKTPIPGPMGGSPTKVGEVGYVFGESVMNGLIDNFVLMSQL